MKKYIYLFIISLSLFLTSCEDFLDRQPKSSLSQETCWQTEQDLKTWNAGIYDGLQATLKNNWFYWGELRSGVYKPRGTAYDTNLLYNGLSSSTGSSNWESLYSTIYRTNAAIAHIPGCPVAVTTSNNYLAQAYAMRALMYFYAIRIWGDVPKITEPMEDIANQERYYGRTSVMDLKNFILDDLDRAIEAFGASTDLGSAVKYYLNRGSAMAIKLDVLMWYKEYDKALVIANDLIKNYGYQSEPASSYAKMFLNPTSSKEMIFNLYWNYEQDGGGFGYAQEIASGSNTIRYHPTEEIYKELVTRKREDVRTILIMDTIGISSYITPDEMTEEAYAKAYNGDYGNTANFQIKCPKFAEANDKGAGYTYKPNGECNVEMPIYRITDVKLLRAEALVLGTKKDYQGAVDAVNEVRRRAGWSVEAKLADYPSEKDLIKLIIDERTIEFWAEGKRWFDIVRNDLVKEYLDQYMIDADVDNAETDGFNIGVTKPSPDHIGGYGRILWPLYLDVFRKNPSMKGHQNAPYGE